KWRRLSSLCAPGSEAPQAGKPAPLFGPGCVLPSAGPPPDRWGGAEPRHDRIHVNVVADSAVICLVPDPVTPALVLRKRARTVEESIRLTRRIALETLHDPRQ